MTLRNQCAFVYRISYTIYGAIQLVRFDLFDLFCFVVWNIVFNFGRKVSAKEEKQRQQHCQTLATVNSLPLSLLSLPPSLLLVAPLQVLCDSRSLRLLRYQTTSKSVTILLPEGGRGLGAAALQPSHNSLFIEIECRLQHVNESIVNVEQMDALQVIDIQSRWRIRHVWRQCIEE